MPNIRHVTDFWNSYSAEFLKNWCSGTGMSDRKNQEKWGKLDRIMRLELIWSNSIILIHLVLIHSMSFSFLFVHIKTKQREKVTKIIWDDKVNLPRLIFAIHPKFCQKLDNILSYIYSLHFNMKTTVSGDPSIRISCIWDTKD